MLGGKLSDHLYTELRKKGEAQTQSDIDKSSILWQLEVLRNKFIVNNALQTYVLL